MGQPIPGSGMETTRTGVCIVLAWLIVLQIHQESSSLSEVKFQKSIR